MNVQTSASTLLAPLFVALLLAMQSSAGSPDAGRVTTPFDADWRFLKADVPGAEKVGFDDSAWRSLDVPHDWSIEGPFSRTNKTGGAGGFLPSGVGWYRKVFTLPEEVANQCVFVEFDGVMANSDVWINGHLLGHRPNGYVSFRYELTPYLRSGEDGTNVIAVRTDTSAQPASRWYSGAGIYRHVRLVTTHPVHFDYHSTFVSTPEIGSNRAVVRVETRLVNESDEDREVSVMASILGPPHSAPDGRYGCSGESKPTPVAAGGAVTVSFDVEMPWSPLLWDVDHPDLHKAVVRLRTSGQTLDRETVSFGIREAMFTSDQGFVLNGRKVILKGVCLHHDAGGLGAAVPLSAWESRLSALKELGCNAIRTAHNPVAPEFLDLCDRMGFLVMDEFFDCWTVGKNRFDYHLYFDEWSLTDLRDTVRRDRNHPSIVIYSAGNEIHDTPRPELAKRILAGLVREYHSNDPTRPVTQGLFRPNVSGDYTNGLSDLLDVVGTNYRDKELLAAQKDRPERRIVGTEQRHELGTWLDCRDNPSHSGQFLWTGIDYLGEARHWPRNAHASGLLDRTGAPKPMAFQRQSWWSDKPMVRIARRVAADDVLPTDPGYGGEERHTQVTFSDWSPRNREAHTENVEGYSNCKSVELLLNGRSLGAQEMPGNDSPRRWKVAFEEGTLEALARDGGPVVARHELRTAAAPARLRLSAERKFTSPTWDDVVYVRVEVTDGEGVLIPYASDTIRFDVSGPGRIVAVDSADCMSLEPFQVNERNAYGGTCVAVIRATAVGQLVVTARAEGLEPASVVIEVRPSSRTFDFDSAASSPGAQRVPVDAAFTVERGYGFDFGSRSDPAAGGLTGGQPFHFSVALPEGNYEVTLTFGDVKYGTTNTVKAEMRRLMLERVVTRPGDFVTRTVTVNIRTPAIPDGDHVRLKQREKDNEMVNWDDKLTLEFNGARPGLVGLEVAPAEVPTLFLLGDSTVCDQPHEPWNSWGQMLPRFFKPGIAIANNAQSGESIRSSLGAKRFAKVFSQMRAGDWLFVQYGHNDMKDKATNALATYKANLKRIVARTREKGASPVLVTSMERKAGVKKDTLAGYPQTVRDVAREEGVPLIDLHTMSRTLYQALGTDLNEAFQDGTHHNAYGSYELARCVVRGIRQNNLPLAQYLVDDVPDFDPAYPDSPDAFFVPPSPQRSDLKPDGE